MSVLKKIAAVIVIVLAVIGFLFSAGGLIGVWVVRAPAVNTVNAVFDTAQGALAVLDEALTTVDGRLGEARAALAEINAAAAQMGERIATGTPVLTLLDRLVGEDLRPKIETSFQTANAISESVVAFNTTLETVNRIPGVNVPTLTDELKTIDARLDEVRTELQTMQMAINEAKAGVADKAVTTITTPVNRIDTALATVESDIETRQPALGERIDRLESQQSTLVLLINVATVFFTLLFPVLAAGQVLLIQRMWALLKA